MHGFLQPRWALELGMGRNWARLLAKSARICSQTSAHIAGLVAAGIHPRPDGHTRILSRPRRIKTLRGRGGRPDFDARKIREGKIDSNIFPGIQGGPLEHVIAAAKAGFAFTEALQPSFKTYQQQIVKNCVMLADGMKRNGYRLVSGGTDNHLFQVDVGAKGITGKDSQIARGTRAGNQRSTKHDSIRDALARSRPAGIRLGTAGLHHARHEGIRDGGDCRHDFRSAAGHQKCGRRAQSPPPACASWTANVSMAVLKAAEQRQKIAHGEAVGSIRQNSKPRQGRQKGRPTIG